MAEIIARNDNELTIQVTIKLTGSLLEMENTILDSFNLNPASPKNQTASSVFYSWIA
jgi:hypothetical protein